MTITLAGGITLFGITVAPPPSENTAAWFGGGYGPGLTSIVDRITFATDTATASVRGPLSSASAYMAAAGNSTDGWWAGGRRGDPSYTSTVERITYATDTAATSTRGPLSSARNSLAAAGGIQ